MVAINPFNYEQVAIIFIFLSILIGVLFFVRKNKFILKTKFQNEKSISVIEDVAINQTERLRLVKVGDETFLMSSGKGISAQLIKLDPENSASKTSKLQNLENKVHGTSWVAPAVLQLRCAHGPPSTPQVPGRPFR